MFTDDVKICASYRDDIEQSPLQSDLDRFSEFTDFECFKVQTNVVFVERSESSAINFKRERAGVGYGSS